MSIKFKIETRRSPGRTSEKFEMPIKCVHCGHDFRKSLAELRSDPVLSCPNCSEQFKVDTGGTARQLSDSLDGLDRAFDRLGK